MPALKMASSARAGAHRQRDAAIDRFGDGLNLQSGSGFDADVS